MHNNTEKKAHRQEKKRGLRQNPRYVALRLLSIRSRSVLELTKRLQEKGFSEIDIRSVIEDYKAQGILNDARTAREVIRAVLARKPVGRRYLSLRLRVRDIPQNIANEALRELLPPETEGRLLKTAAEKYAKRRVKNDAVSSAALFRFLSAQGFESHAILALLPSLTKRGEREYHTL